MSAVITGNVKPPEASFRSRSNITDSAAAMSNVTTLGHVKPNTGGAAGAIPQVSILGRSTLVDNPVISTVNQVRPKKNPPKPRFVETTSTHFELVKITGNISVCTGCSGQLKHGPGNKIVSPFDNNLCIRHEENDHVLIQNGCHPYWMKKFTLRYYHVNKDCIIGRNPSFDSNKLSITKLSTITDAIS